MASFEQTTSSEIILDRLEQKNAECPLISRVFLRLNMSSFHRLLRTCGITVFTIFIKRPQGQRAEPSNNSCLVPSFCSDKSKSCVQLERTGRASQPFRRNRIFESRPCLSKASLTVVSGLSVYSNSIFSVACLDIPSEYMTTFTSSARTCPIWTLVDAAFRWYGPLAPHSMISLTKKRN